MQASDETGDYYRKSTKRALQLLLWGIAWCATLAVAKFGPEFWWGAQAALSWAAIAVNLAVGITWIVTFTLFIRTLDELDRKIMLDALAITLGAGWIGGFSWIVADAAGVLPGDLEIAVFPAALGVVFLIAFFAGKVRYR